MEGHKLLPSLSAIVEYLDNSLIRVKRFTLCIVGNECIPFKRQKVFIVMWLTSNSQWKNIFSYFGRSNPNEKLSLSDPKPIRVDLCLLKELKTIAITSSFGRLFVLSIFKSTNNERWADDIYLDSGYTVQLNA